MKPTTASIAGSITRHAMTAGGVAGVATAPDLAIQILSLLITLAGLVWSIVEKLRRPSHRNERQNHGRTE